MNITHTTVFIFMSFKLIEVISAMNLDNDYVNPLKPNFSGQYQYTMSIRQIATIVYRATLAYADDAAYPPDDMCYQTSPAQNSSCPQHCAHK